MRNGAIFWGSLIILVGAALMVGNVFTVDVWPYLWPAALIFIGAWFLIGSQLRPKAAETEQAVIPLQGASRVRLQIRHGAGRLMIRGGAGSNEVAAGSFSGGLEHTENRHGDTLDVKMSVPSGMWMNFGGPWLFRPCNPPEKDPETSTFDAAPPRIVSRPAPCRIFRFARDAPCNGIVTCSASAAFGRNCDPTINHAPTKISPTGHR